MLYEPKVTYRNALFSILAANLFTHYTFTPCVPPPPKKKNSGAYFIASVPKRREPGYATAMPLCQSLVVDTASNSIVGGKTVRYPSVCLSQLSTAATACGGFAAVGPASRIYRSIGDCCRAGARQQWRRAGSSMASHAAAKASGSKCEQCHVFSRRRRLNTDLLFFSMLWKVFENETSRQVGGRSSR